MHTSVRRICRLVCRSTVITTIINRPTTIWQVEIACGQASYSPLTVVLIRGCCKAGVRCPAIALNARRDPMVDWVASPDTGQSRSFDAQTGADSLASGRIVNQCPATRLHPTPMQSARVLSRRVGLLDTRLQQLDH
jgi:hypothetical protein